MSLQPSKPAGHAPLAGLILRLAGGVGLALLVILLLVLPPSAGTAPAMDRAALGRVLETIPPNGPFWKHGNVTMRSRTRAARVDPVVFPHWSHRSRYTCRVCHIELGFSMSAGGSGVTRRQYLAGAFCGTCHDGKTAFSAREESGSNCGRCHMQDPGELRKRFEAFAAKLPVASFGNGIDWARALKEGLIKPVPTLQGTVIMPLPEKLTKPLKLGTTSPRSDVLFSHEDHFAELDCSSCHPDLFNIQKKGTQAFTMDRNIFGDFCGACHMRVAFPMNDCRRCHPQMQNITGV
jgi:c(7)-type cytochrome triheme protein